MAKFSQGDKSRMIIFQNDSNTKVANVNSVAMKIIKTTLYKYAHNFVTNVNTNHWF